MAGCEGKILFPEKRDANLSDLTLSFSSEGSGKQKVFPLDPLLIEFPLWSRSARKRLRKKRRDVLVGFSNGKDPLSLVQDQVLSAENIL